MSSDKRLPPLKGAPTGKKERQPLPSIGKKSQPLPLIQSSSDTPHTSPHQASPLTSSNPIPAVNAHLPKDKRVGKVRSTKGCTRNMFIGISLIIGLLMFLLGICFSMIGFVEDGFNVAPSVDKTSFRISGPILIGSGILLVIAGYVFFRLVYGKNLSTQDTENDLTEYRSDANVTPTVTVAQARQDMENIAEMFQARPKGWVAGGVPQARDVGVEDVQ